MKRLICSINDVLQMSISISGKEHFLRRFGQENVVVGLPPLIESIQRELDKFQLRNLRPIWHYSVLRHGRPHTKFEQHCETIILVFFFDEANTVRPIGLCNRRTTLDYLKLWLDTLIVVFLFLSLIGPTIIFWKQKQNLKQ